MTGEVIQNLGIAGFAILVFYFIARSLLTIFGSFITNISQALRDNALAVGDLRQLLSTLTVDQVEREAGYMTEIRASFQRLEDKMEQWIEDCNDSNP